MISTKKIWEVKCSSHKLALQTFSGQITLGLNTILIHQNFVNKFNDLTGFKDSDTVGHSLLCLECTLWH